MKSMALGLLLGFVAAQAFAGGRRMADGLGQGAGQGQGGEENGAGGFHRLGLVPAVQGAAQECSDVDRNSSNYAKDNLVLVEIDFPRSKPQSDELKKANKELAKKHEIKGYPTVIVLDSEGKEL